jgi:hypothetical protein
VKRDTPSSLSNLHHQTANASTNTPTYENMCSPSFLTSPMTNKSASTELGTIGIPMKITSSSTSSLVSTPTMNTGNLLNKINKMPINQQDSLSLSPNLTSRLETNQELTPNAERKPFIVSEK